MTAPLRTCPTGRGSHLGRTSTGSPPQSWQKPPPPRSHAGAGAGPAHLAPRGPCSVFIDFISFLFLPAEPVAVPGGRRCAALPAEQERPRRSWQLTPSPGSAGACPSVLDGHTTRPVSVGSDVLAATSAPCRHRAGCPVWGACGGEWGARCTAWGAAWAARCAKLSCAAHTPCRVCGAGCRVHRVWCMWCGVQGARRTARAPRFGLLWSGLGAVRLGTARPAAGGEPAGAAAPLPQRKNPVGGMPWL